MDLLSIEDVRDYFEALNTTEKWGARKFYCYKLDNKEEKSLGFYNKNNKAFETPIGGVENTTYRELSCSLLIHWNKNHSETEKVSKAIYERIINFYKQDIEMNNHKINFIELLSDCVDVGTDDKMVCEYVIEFKIYYSV